MEKFSPPKENAKPVKSTRPCVGSGIVVSATNTTKASVRVGGHAGPGVSQRRRFFSFLLFLRENKAGVEMVSRASGVGIASADEDFFQFHSHSSRIRRTHFPHTFYTPERRFFPPLEKMKRKVLCGPVG